LELFRTTSRNTSRDQEVIGSSWDELWPFPLLGRSRLRRRRSARGLS
jgi:hypothetical protein